MRATTRGAGSRAARRLATGAVAGVLVASGTWLGAPASGAPAQPSGVVATVEPPFELTDPVTDRAGVLGGDAAQLRGEIRELREDHDIQLFAVFVDSFSGDSGEQWARNAYETSGMGGNDVLLAVAVEDRRYATWTTSDSGLTAEQDASVRSEFIEPQLSRGRWAEAVRGAVEGYGRAADGDRTPGRSGSGGGFIGFGGGSLCCLLLPLGAVALFILRSRRRRRPSMTSFGFPPSYPVAPQPQDRRGPRERSAPRQRSSAPPRSAATEQLDRDAASALVNLDDAIRSSAEELESAEAQLGGQVTRPFRAALEEARQQATRAFGLRRTLDEDRVAGVLDEPTEQSRLQEILSLAAEADRTLDAQEADFARLRSLEGNVTQFLRELRRRLGEVRARVPAAEDELASLAIRNSPEVLRTVRANLAQARNLVEAVDGFLLRGEQHAAADDRKAAVVDARAAEEAIAQADKLLTSVGRARDELASAVPRLDQAIASISADVADAQRLRADDQRTTEAVAQARSAIEVGTAAREGGDPLAALRQLTRAEQELDGALASYREKDERAARGRAIADERLSQVGALLEDIDSTIQSKRGAVGAEARTHMAEADRLYREALAVADTDLARMTQLLDQAEEQAELALALTEEDVDGWNDHYGGPSGFGGGFGISPGSLILGGILGGVIGGGVMGGGIIGGRGGGWGGSGGGFGGGDFGGGGRF